MMLIYGGHVWLWWVGNMWNFEIPQKLEYYHSQDIYEGTVIKVPTANSHITNHYVKKGHIFPRSFP